MQVPASAAAADVAHEGIKAKRTQISCQAETVQQLLLATQQSA